MRKRPSCRLCSLAIFCCPTALDYLRWDIINDLARPDFISMSERAHPFSTIDVLQPGRTVEVADLLCISNLGFITTSARNWGRSNSPRPKWVVLERGMSIDESIPVSPGTINKRS
jgi:hypothetical protein